MYEPEILHRAWERLNVKNEHFMLCLVGAEGDGKSLTSIKIAKTIDPNFTADNVLFKISEFLKILRDENYEPGDVYILDEAGVSLGKRTWQERAQVLANQALQLVRSHNVGLIFTLPRLGGLDSQAVARLQAFYEIVQKVKDEYVRGKWKYIDPDRTDETGTNYKKKPRVYRDGNKIRVDWLKFSPPEGDVVDEYLERKEAHQKEVYDQAISELEDDNEEEQEREITASDIAEKVKEQGVDEYISDNYGQKYIDRDLIEVDFGIGSAKSKRVKKVLERDGAVA